MNFLAHLILSGDDEQIKIGNFIGDFVKGADIYNYPEKIQQGIKLHRKIDEYTDNHEIVMESKVRLRDTYHHYAPVIVDLYYDHFLSKNWSDYHDEDLKSYTNQFYKLIKGYTSLPKTVNNMLFYMEKDDWLFNYGTMRGIEEALKGMARRTRFDSKMEMAHETLVEHYTAFQDEFRRFFPLLQDFSKDNL